MQNSIDSEPKDPLKPIFDYSPDVFRSAVLQIEGPNIGNKLIKSALDAGFRAKAEFHVTLIPSELFDKLSTHAGGRERVDALAKVLESVCAQLQGLDFETTAYLINKPKITEEDNVKTAHERQSIVLPVSLDCELARAVSQAYIDLGFDESDLPFLHVTLYTFPENDIAAMGIGIANNAEWESLGPVVFNDVD